MTSEILALLNAAAERYGVDPSLVVAVANQESGGNQFDRSGAVLTSPAGALGVMQLKPATAAGLGVDPTDTAENIDGGVRYLAQLLRQFGGDPQLALAAYNWGPGNVSKNGLLNWPAETVSYVSSILSKVGSAIAAPFSSSGTDTGTPPDTSGSGTPDTGSLVVLAVAGGLVLWALAHTFGS